jgi:hypothetical protein
LDKYLHKVTAQTQHLPQQAPTQPAHPQQAAIHPQQAATQPALAAPLAVVPVAIKLDKKYLDQQVNSTKLYFLFFYYNIFDYMPF